VSQLRPARRPGFIATEMLEHVPEKKVLDEIKERIPVGRRGRPDEIARVEHFLVGDRSSFITGAVWNVNVLTPYFRQATRAGLAHTHLGIR
jgi:NAD(P)-dependent dehydrogenase (short-subunit alcohol dehydrogenase family)